MNIKIWCANLMRSVELREKHGEEESVKVCFDEEKLTESFDDIVQWLNNYV
jgi:hypothetical protein